MNPVVAKLNRENLKSEEETSFNIGDNVKIDYKIKEGDKERIQIFAGYVIARDGVGNTETFTVRRISHGVGVEKVFPVHSPLIEKLEVQSSSYVRRAKLYFLRDRTGKKARLREKIKAKK